MKIKNRKIQVLLIAGLAIFILAASVLALTGAEIPRYQIGAGGSSQGDGYTLSGSIERTTAQTRSPQRCDWRFCSTPSSQ